MANGPYEFISTFKTDPFEEQRIAADRQRRMAELLAQQSEQYGQYQTPRGPLGEVKYPVSQGLAQLATALGGAFKRGRAEREERELREGETAARGEANTFMSDVISGRYQLPPADQTLSDTAIPGEMPSAQDMSILQRLQAGIPGLSEAAQSYVSPFAQQLGLSEAMADQERARAREDFAAQQAIEAKYRETPETFRQLRQDELPPGVRFGQQNVKTGEIKYDYIPANIMYGGQGGGAPVVAPVSIQNRDLAAINNAQEQSVAAAPGLQALERTIAILTDPNFDSSGIFMPETGIINNVMAYFGNDAAKQIATDINLLKAGGDILGITALQGIGGSDTERELAVATRTGFNPRGTTQENLALARAKQATLMFQQEYPLLASEWVQKYGSLHPSYGPENGQTFSQFANNAWQQIKDQTGAAEFFGGRGGRGAAPPAQGGAAGAPLAQGGAPGASDIQNQADEILNRGRPQ